MYREVGLRKAEAVEALAILEETGHVRPAFGTEMGDEGRRGRKASRAWEVNPLATVSIHASVREPGRRAQEGPGSPETAFWCALFSYARDPPCHRARGGALNARGARKTPYHGAADRLVEVLPG